MQRLIMFFILAVAMFVTPSCKKYDQKPINTEMKKTFVTEKIKISGADVVLTVVKTAIDRVIAGKSAPVEKIKNNFFGVLYVYDGTSPIAFKKEINTFKSDIAFLDENGMILDIQQIKETPHDPDISKNAQYLVEQQKQRYQQEKGEPMPPDYEKQVLQWAKQLIADKGYISGAFPKGSLGNAKFILNMPGEFFENHQLKVGKTIELGKKLLNLNGEENKPVIEYRSQFTTNDQQEKTIEISNYLTVKIAETVEKRELALSRKALETLGDNEVCAIVYDKEKQINFHVKDLKKVVYVMPVILPESTFNASTRSLSTTKGTITKLEPPTAGTKELGVLVKNALNIDPAYRNYEFTTLKKYNCLIIFSRKAIESLNLKFSDMQTAEFEFEVPGELINCFPEADPERYDVLYRYSHDGKDAEVKANVKVIQKEVARRRELLMADQLKNLTEKEKTEGKLPQGYLLRFDRERIRPVFTAGLKAPFDIALLNAENSLVDLIEVPDENYLTNLLVYGDMLDFSKVAYQTIWIMPYKWFATAGLFSSSEGLQPKPVKGVLFTSTIVSRSFPEPERYRIFVGDVPVYVEVQLDGTERKRGLQWRNDLPPDCGMFFVYTEEAYLKFWMPNCLLDMSIAYITKDWQVASIVKMLRPYNKNLGDDEENSKRRPKNNTVSLEEESLRKYKSKALVKYALEMDADWFANHNLSAGKTINIEGSPIKKFIEQSK